MCIDFLFSTWNVDLGFPLFISLMILVILVTMGFGKVMEMLRKKLESTFLLNNYNKKQIIG